MPRRKFKIIACNVMWRELCFFAARTGHAFAYRFLPYGLHGEPDGLRRELQQAIDASGDGYEALLLGYGLCSKGVEGIVARSTRLVIPRGHDCMTCFLGSKERYRAYFDSHPGTYWYTPGWIENHLPPGKERYETHYRQYAQTYGEENARYLMEMEQGWFREYSTAAYIDLGVGNSAGYEAFTRKCAAWLKWTFTRLDGDPGLVEGLVGGTWDADAFLVVEPGHEIRATHDERIMTSAPAAGTPCT
jgi:hypothetical protein